MVHNFFIRFVKKVCKTIRKVLWIIFEKVCGKPLESNFYVYKKVIPLTFSKYFTFFSTNLFYLFPTILFHYSTRPTITTTNNFHKRKDKK